ncbi:hypothetical protein B4Q13_17965, partial [Lacticaseibacillus rhamnosus]
MRFALDATGARGAGSGGLDVAASAQAVAEGTLLGAYRFTRHKKATADDGSPSHNITLLPRPYAPLHQAPTEKPFGSPLPRHD